MRKILSISSIYISPVSIDRLEVIIKRNLGIELDKYGGIFIEVTVEMLDLVKMILAQDRKYLAKNCSSIHTIDTA